jgi:DNA replication and repair protein RecF
MIKTVKLKNFRNHQNLELNFNNPFVYIHGENGSGKTSILESIYFIATTKSHRTNDEKELILRNEQFAQVKVVTTEDKYEITLTKTGKRAIINGVEKRKLSDFIGHLRVVMFSPEDLELIKGSPLNRRQFMDLEWMQIDKTYLKNLNTYKNIIKQRNSLLKKIKIDDDYTFLNILGEQLLEIGIEIINQRKKFIHELNLYLQEVYQLFSKHQIKMTYTPDVDEKAFKNHIYKNQKQDILYQTTLAGPHRDDFLVDFNDFEAKSYASQGEQRLIVIAIKLALLKLIENKTNQKVVLLLDDIFSELDLEKQELFMKQIPKEHQIIMNSVQNIIDPSIQMIRLKKE